MRSALKLIWPSRLGDLGAQVVSHRVKSANAENSSLSECSGQTSSWPEAFSFRSFRHRFTVCRVRNRLQKSHETAMSNDVLVLPCNRVSEDSKSQTKNCAMDLKSPGIFLLGSSSCWGTICFAAPRATCPHRSHCCAIECVNAWAWATSRVAQCQKSVGIGVGIG